MVFQVSQTFYDPQDSQSGFAEPGAGAQTTGDPSFVSMPQPVIEYEPERPIKGLFSWLFPYNNRGMQTGQPEVLNALQHRPPGSMPNLPDEVTGIVEYNWTPEYSRGAAAYVPITGKVLTNPIGAGIVAMQRPQASYGPAGEYINGAIWWTSQQVPTTVDLNGLISPEQIAALVGDMNVQAMVRVG